VAIGLTLNCSQRFARYGATGQALGDTIIGVITATTFLLQIIGPVFKFAIARAGEIGRARVAQDGWASEGTADHEALIAEPAPDEPAIL
jgi:hypothetical protein